MTKSDFKPGGLAVPQSDLQRRLARTYPLWPKRVTEIAARLFAMGISGRAVAALIDRNKSVIEKHRARMPEHKNRRPRLVHADGVDVIGDMRAYAALRRMEAANVEASIVALQARADALTREATEIDANATEAEALAEEARSLLTQAREAQHARMASDVGATS